MCETGLLHAGDVDAIEARVKAEIDAAVAFAERGTPEAAADLLRFVTMDEVPQEVVGR
jgi:TPP-dependent pyruvate/acetoin dehydrogenase alpha subunit